MLLLKSEMYFINKLSRFVFQNGTPLWEDFMAKATKLHTCLRLVLLFINV